MTRRGREASAHTEHEFVYRTIHLYEADLVANEFERAGLPYFRAAESPVGVQFAMPAAPAPEPGCWWLVIVPPTDARRAHGILEDLPVSKQSEAPEFWPVGPESKARKFFKAWAWLSLLVMLAALLAALFW
jgi:hypothetical protein